MKTAKLLQMKRLFLFGLSQNHHDGGTDPIEADVWEQYRRNALRYLRASNATPGSILMLEQLPFSCEWMAFYDEIEGHYRNGNQALMLRVPVEVFVEIELERGGNRGQTERFQ